MTVAATGRSAIMEWFKSLDFGDRILNETLAEYLVTLAQLTDKVERFDKRIAH